VWRQGRLPVGAQKGRPGSRLHKRRRRPSDGAKNHPAVLRAHSPSRAFLAICGTPPPPTHPPPPPPTRPELLTIGFPGGVALAITGEHERFFRRVAFAERAVRCSSCRSWSYFCEFGGPIVVGELKRHLLAWSVFDETLLCLLLSLSNGGSLKIWGRDSLYHFDSASL